MKTLLKILTPTISSIGIATIALTSCGTKSVDGLVAIPTEYLNIKDSNLNGLKKEQWGEFVDLVEMGYNKLTIPNNITKVDDFSYQGEAYVGYKAITKIEFQADRTKDCTIASYCFNALPDLAILELPKDSSKIIVNENSFNSCNELVIIDFSDCETINDSFKTVEWISFGEGAKAGKLYANSNNKAIVEAIKTKNTQLKDWSIEVK